MNIKIKTFISKTCLSILVAGTVMGSTVAFAGPGGVGGNISDTGHYFFFSDKKQQYTNPRPKYDSTSLYMRPTYFQGKQSYDKVKVEAVKSNEQSFGNRYIREITEKASYYIPSDAYETYGYGVEVRIKAECPTIDLWHNLEMRAVWSPDSV